MQLQPVSTSEVSPLPSIRRGSNPSILSILDEARHSAVHSERGPSALAAEGSVSHGSSPVTAARTDSKSFVAGSPELIGESTEQNEDLAQRDNGENNILEETDNLQVANGQTQSSVMDFNDIGPSNFSGSRDSLRPYYGRRPYRAAHRYVVPPNPPRRELPHVMHAPEAPIYSTGTTTRVQVSAILANVQCPQTRQQAYVSSI